MDKTAIRVGTNRDLKARKKAYGLTTLQHEHVKVSGSKISFDFIAKEGIRAKYEFSDKDCAKFISDRLSTTKKGQMLFSDTNADKLNNYLSKVAGGKKYTAKDFRTFHANVIAYREINKYSGIKFKTKKEKKAAIKDVITQVSDFLRNTPNVAKNSYINPKVWDVIGGLK